MVLFFHQLLGCADDHSKVTRTTFPAGHCTCTSSPDIPACLTAASLPSTAAPPIFCPRGGRIRYVPPRLLKSVASVALPFAHRIPTSSPPRAQRPETSPSGHA